MKTGDKYSPHGLFHGSFIPDWLMEDKTLSPGTKLVFARLAKYAGKDGVAFPKQSTLAEAVGLSERQVHSCLKELIDRKYIEAERATGSARLAHAATRYRFLWPDIAEMSLRTGKNCSSGKEESAAPLNVKESQLKENQEAASCGSDFQSGGNGNGNGWPPRALRDCPKFAADPDVKARWDECFTQWQKAYGFRTRHSLDIPAIIQDCHDFEVRKGKLDKGRIDFIGESISRIATTPKLKERFQFDSPWGE